MTQVKLPNGNYVNPSYVTTIRTTQGRYDIIWTELWVVGHAGYGTLSYIFKGDVRDELALLLNGVAK
jgi:hypothetical protein